MSGFKEQMQRDLEVFIDLDKFGEPHVVESASVTCIIDDNTTKARQGGAQFGLAEVDLVLYAASKDLPRRKQTGSPINIDGREYTVVSWVDNMGMAEISLSSTAMI